MDDPGLLELLKAALGHGEKKPGGTVDPRVHNTVPKSLMDTLFAVGGRPQGGIAYDTTTVTPSLFEPTPALAAYNPDSDRMRQTKYGAAKPAGSPSLDPSTQFNYAEEPPPDYQLGHEFGHRIHRQGLAPSLVDAVLKDDTAYGMDEDERFARNFASGLNRVRATEGMGGIDASRTLSQSGPRGSESPVADWLLERPIYANHPAAVARHASRVPSDATRAKPRVRGVTSKP